MVSIGGAATEDSADPQLIVSFGVCLVCPLTTQVSIIILKKSYALCLSSPRRSNSRMSFCFSGELRTSRRVTLSGLSVPSNTLAVQHHGPQHPLHMHLVVVVVFDLVTAIPCKILVSKLQRPPKMTNLERKEYHCQVHK
jgi:hypothetical protein